MSKRSRAFIIGDKENGLTIVITDPVMVVHYSKDDLTNARTNQMNMEEPIVSMAAVVQDLLPLLRGVDVVQMRAMEQDVLDHPDRYNLDEERALFSEMDYARTIGQIIRNNGTVCDVDFCVALDIDPCEIVAKGRNTGPAVEIADYLVKYSDCADASEKSVPSRPRVFNITQLETDNLGPLPPWVNPRP